MSQWYTNDPVNPTLADVDARINYFVQSRLLYGNYAPRSIPQSALDVPLVTEFPKGTPQDGDELNLRNGNFISRWIWNANKPGWVPLDAQESGTTLPVTNLYQGRRFIYDTGTSGVRWELIYDTTDGTTYPWLVVGGSPLTARVDTNETTASGTYAALATAGPSVTLPLAGDYIIRGNSNSYNSGTNTNLHSYDIGGTGAIDTNAGQNGFAAATSSAQLPFENLHTGLAAATAIVSKYRTTGGTANFRNRWITAMPVRVG